METPSPMDSKKPIQKKLIILLSFLVLIAVGAALVYFKALPLSFWKTISENTQINSPQKATFSGITLEDSLSRDRKIIGEVKGKFTKIAVISSFSGAKDKTPYLLSKYAPDTYRFEYNISPALGNIGIGLNQYFFTGTREDGTEDTIPYEFWNNRSIFHYPDCDTNDVIIGDYIWASCDVGASSTTSDGKKYVWSKDWYRKLDTNVCAKGYHVPSTTEWADIYHSTKGMVNTTYLETFLNDPNARKWEKKIYWTSQGGSDNEAYTNSPDDVRDDAARAYKDSPHFVRCILDRQTEALAQIKDPFILGALQAVIARFKKDSASNTPTDIDNRTFESKTWKVVSKWDKNPLHYSTLTVTNKQTGESMSKNLSYGPDWTDEILAMNKESCTNCSESEKRKMVE